MAVSIVDTECSLVALLDCLENLPTQPPSLYLDLEGVRLSRYGSISIVQLFVLPRNHVFLIDIFVLQRDAFRIANQSGTDLRSILESPLVPKVCFDIRNDSDALFAHFAISMRGFNDVQLLEIATRSYSKERVAGLAKCIESDAQLTTEAKEAWKATKQKGLSLFAAEHGGSPEIFNTRPMLQDLIDYCTQDVVYLPVLWHTYSRKISKTWAARVQKATDERILMSQAVSYEPHGKHKALSPWAKAARQGKGRGSGDIGVPQTTGRNNINAAHIVATQAVQEKVGKQLSDIMSRPLSMGEPNPHHSKNMADSGTTRKPLRIKEQVGVQNLPVRSKTASDPETSTTPDTLLHPAAVPPNWTCTTCSRQMQETQKSDHLAGKQHMARVKQAASAGTEAPPPPQPDKATHMYPRAGGSVVTKPQNADTKLRAKPLVFVPAQSNVPAHSLKAKGANRRKKLPKESLPQRVRLSCQSGWGFSGLGGGDDYGLCDKDCGWCGHCMDGVDV